ncbi:hypothetical protein THASP1DRAFT_28541 [Thamnocephalis sphaerospora]|uniref:Gfd2/YDR514C-like C-terminal domain-containing protein n=1 Tax=Thamnocephalis sphaerospora TaxID=78915 RepID=A0A4P9XU03_9FUNG|nr:hypothetical protein THASP1DRAFT_28541 [Thamnocephalis sphaerospora]|eukprot:RKP09656.1 hypothetical protein THASP1DRAFT_28541 [Thamnocephalis sphaerospora]
MTHPGSSSNSAAPAAAGSRCAEASTPPPGTGAAGSSAPPAAPVPLNGAYFQLSQLSAEWQAFVEADEEARSCIRNYFRVPQFYVAHADWDVCIATCCEAGRRVIALDEGQVRAVKAELESVLARPLPTLQPASTYADGVVTRITDNATYQTITKSLSRHNQTFKHQERQAHFRQLLETARELYRAKTHIFLALDVESWERDHSRILEIGWSMYDSRRDRFLDVHYNVSEFRHLYNGRYVPDHRNNFVFGTSTWATLREAAAAIQRDLDADDAPLVFIGHAVKEDLRYLERLGVKVPGTAVSFDTAQLYQAVNGATQPTGLGKMLDALSIEHIFLHNAGNDAHYTLEAFLALTK